MKKTSTLFCAGVLMGALCAVFIACNDETGRKFGLGEEIPGVETFHAAGTILGGYSNGFGSVLVQVDEEFPIGNLIEYFDFMPCTTLPEDGTYQNMIQVQCHLPKAGSRRISFSFREYREKKDRDLFIIGAGIGNALCAAPNVPIYVIIDLKPINN